MEKIDNIYRLLASKKSALYLFIGLAVLLVPNTLLSRPVMFLDWTMQAILGLLVVNLSFCTIQRFKTLRNATILIHIGTIVTLAGGMTSSLGYVATINVYEGSSTDTVYRWDIEQDIPLGFEMKIREIRREFYPIPVRVGVLDRGRGDSLHTVKTGESFQWREFTVLVDSFDPDRKSLTLQVQDKDGKLLGTYETAGQSSLPVDFPLTFQLVAYKDPVLKNVGAYLVMSEGQEILTEGLTMINAPFKWRGLKFHVTNVAVDPYGLPYIGIQVVRDPGVYFTYAGFIIICFGCLLHLLKFL